MGNWADGPVKLLGRSDALAAAGAGLARGGGIMVVGAPGVGKTALVRAVLDDLRAAGETPVLSLMALPSGGDIPFGAFAPVVPEVAGGPREDRDHFSLLQAIRQEVVDRASRAGLVLAVDDAHYLDPASAVLLAQLVTTGTAKAVMAVTSDEPLAPALRSMWKDDVVERIDLQPLDRAETLELAEMLLDGPADDELAEALWEHSEGNPLYLRELIVGGSDAGRIGEERGVWRLAGGLTIGPRLQDLLNERLGVLPDALRDSLEVVAFAEPCPLAAAGRVVPDSHLDDLQRRGLVAIETAGDGGYAGTSHRLYGELLRARLPEHRSRELGRLLADAFEQSGRRHLDLLRIASWRLQAGASGDPRLFQEAALLAAARFDWSKAAVFAEAAVGSGGGTTATIALADALGHLGRPHEALGVLGDYSGDTDEERARVAVLRASNLFWGLGDWSGANRVLEEVEQAIEDQSERTWIAAVRAGVLNFIGRPDVAVSASRPLLDVPRLSAKARIAAGYALSTSLAWGGLSDQALRVVDAFRPDERGPEVQDPAAVDWSLMVRTSAYRVAGRVRDIEDLGRIEYASAVQTRNPEAKGISLGALAWVALVRGQLSLAVLRYREAIAAYESKPSKQTSFSRRHLLCQLVEALALSGDALGAKVVLAEARAEVRISERWMLPRLWISQAWVAVARDEISGALSELNTAVEEARKGGHVANELEALLCRLRLGATAGAGETVVSRLDELASRVEGDLVQVMALHAHGLADGSADALDAVAERYGLLGLALYAAETAAQASQLHARAAQPRRAAASASRAQSMLIGPDSSRPVTLLLASTPASLTRREREVALLARSGMSSQAIAARLHLSTRTVETHLARVYFKLGISRRSELAEALGIVDSPAG